jgi:hypothetical protein
MLSEGCHAHAQEGVLQDLFTICADAVNNARMRHYLCSSSVNL